MYKEFGIGSFKNTLKPASANARAFFSTTTRFILFIFAGSAPLGAVATLYASPRNPMALFTTGSGRLFVKSGSTSVSGDNGILLSPTPVLKINLPTTFSSVGNTVAETLPVTLDLNWNETVAEDCGCMVSTFTVELLKSSAPETPLGSKLMLTKFAGTSEVFFIVAKRVYAVPVRTVFGCERLIEKFGLRTSTVPDAVPFIFTGPFGRPMRVAVISKSTGNVPSLRPSTIKLA